MGPRRFERPTSSLSGTRSNQLSYEPALAGRISPSAKPAIGSRGAEIVWQRGGVSTLGACWGCGRKMALGYERRPIGNRSGFMRGLEGWSGFDSILCEPNE